MFGFELKNWTIENYTLLEIAFDLNIFNVQLPTLHSKIENSENEAF